MVICYKARKKPNEIHTFKVIGNIKGKNVVVIDDMIDTAGTITIAADSLMKGGALSVRVLATHPVLSGPAIERIEKSQMKELVVADTIPMKHASKKIKVLSIADLFADTIKKVYTYNSISSNFIF